MKQYLLLRNNRETGPHSLEQLGSIGLFSLDLIWIENESTSWSYPEEIEELKNLVKHDLPLGRSNQQQPQSDKIFVSLPPGFIPKQNVTGIDETYSLHSDVAPVSDTDTVHSTIELKENYRTTDVKKPVWNKRIFSSSQAASVAAIFIGVMIGAFVVKKTVDGYVPGTTEEEIADTPIIDREVETQPDENVKNALATEIVPVYKAQPAKAVKKINVKNQLKLSSNNYKVGLFGGINGLQLTVFNLSPQQVDKVIVALDYLKPGGAVVQSENVSFSTIKPKAAQTISIPGSDRGVKVRYKILKVYAHDYKTDLKEI